MKRAALVLTVLIGLVQPSFGQTTGLSGKPFRIGVVVDGPWERNEELSSLLISGILEVTGKGASVEFPPEAFLVGDWTLAGVRTLNDRLLKDPKVDLVLGMGLIASQDLATRGPLPKPTIAPIVIDVVRQHIPMHDGKSGVKNLSYLVYPQTFERDLQLFREIIPISRLVNISSKAYDDVLPPPPVSLKELGRRLGLDVTEIRLSTSANDVLDKLPNDADAVFLEPTLQLPPAEFHRLVNGLIERRLPSFSFFGEDEVRQGIMASANPDLLPRLVRRIALHIQRILDGEEPGSLNVAFTPGKRLTFNLGTAYAVGVSPKWSVLLEAELVHVDTVAPGSMALTFPQAVRRFSEENLDVQAEVQSVNAGAASVSIARSVLLPKIDVGATGLQIDRDRAQAGGLPERSGTFDVSATQLVFAEPALANVSVQSSLQESREQQLAITRFNTIVDGSALYFNYLRARKIFYILLENLKFTRTNVELARVRQSTGVAGQEEVLRWEVEIANLRKIAMDAQSQMNQALFALKQALNISWPYELNVAEMSLEDPSLLVSDRELLGYLDNPLSFELLIDFLTREGAIYAPELRQIDAVIAAEERSLTSTRLSSFVPTISAFAKFSSRFAESRITSPFQLPAMSAAPPPGTPGEAFLYQVLGAFSPTLPDKQDWSVGLQLSLNLFNGLATDAAVRQHSASLDRFRIQRRAVAEKVALRIRIELEKAKASHFAIEQARLEQAAARKTLDIVTNSYSLGAVSILSLLDAQNSTLRADQVAANALYDFLVDYVALQRAIGRFDVLMTPDDRADLLTRLKEYMTKVRKQE
jgi:outer membrane protein